LFMLGGFFSLCEQQTTRGGGEKGALTHNIHNNTTPYRHTNIEEYESKT
jgi:hypothetical protein